MHRPEVTSSLPARRRRRQDQAPRERTSLSLRTDVLEAVRQFVQSGQAENVSAFVESALEDKVRRTRRAVLNAAYAEASQDLEFQRSMSAVTREFRNADSDGLQD